ncbi:MAG: hypothetical protein RL095_1631 [Verrucomicrobiota bacterium]|jgi:predicted PurR-regulated permease PerM
MAISHLTRLADPVKGAFARLREGFGRLSADERRAAAEATARLFVLLVRAAGDGALAAPAITRQLSERFGPKVAEIFNVELASASPLSVAELCPPLLPVSPDDRRAILHALVTAAYHDNNLNPREREILAAVASGLELEPEALEEELTNADEAMRQRGNALSMAGLAAVAAVLGLLLLVATYLTGVLVGLTLACLCLPLQRWYARRLLPSRPAQLVFKLLLPGLIPLRFLVDLVRSLWHGRRLREIQEERRPEDRLAKQSVILTVATLAAGLAGLIFISVVVSSPWFDSARLDFQKYKKESKIEVVSGEEPGRADIDRDLGAYLGDKISRFNEKIGHLPWLSGLAGYLDDPANRNRLYDRLMYGADGNGGLVNFALSNLGACCLHAFLAFFSFLFFLIKLAHFQVPQEGSRSLGQYFAATVFESEWMPRLRASTKSEAAEALDEIIRRLEAWARGFVTICIIETPIYLILFSLVGVPHAFPLALLAGLQVFIPQIGPAVSYSATMLICILVSGSADTSFLLFLGAVTLIYLVIWTFEWIVLYPRFVGTSLNLSFLEIIMAVLLGGIFAGVAGALFAIPTASVLKYLVPRLYAGAGRNLPKAAG